MLFKFSFVSWSYHKHDYTKIENDGWGCGSFRPNDGREDKSFYVVKTYTQ